MERKDGTPTSLEEVVIQILCFRPQPEGIYVADYVRGVFRDYLAQKFGVALLKAHTDEQQAMLQELWKALTGEDNFGRKS